MVTNSKIYRQERPAWCPHADCQFRRQFVDAFCGGQLLKPDEHCGGFNTHRFCMGPGEDDSRVESYMVNGTDLDSLRWIFDALDGKATSWLSKLVQGDTR